MKKNNALLPLKVSPYLRVILVIAYDGTGLHGFQRQKTTKHTVQEILETELSKLANTQIKIMSSGRTDAGVHARVQVVHADLPEKFVTRMLEPLQVKSGKPSGLNRLEEALNGRLPRGIRIYSVRLATPDFHAMYSSMMKTYLYFINPAPVIDPSLIRYTWHLRFPLDWDLMQETAQKLVGTRDFKGFAGKGGSAKTSIRTIHEATFGDVEGFGFADARVKAFRITGSGFLKQMVRNIVGTLVFIGQGKASPQLIDQMLINKKRHEGGPTAPAHGLWLWDIKY